ncbi:hypothetical protein P3W33_17760 [Luteibacter sp. PPL552]
MCTFFRRQRIALLILFLSSPSNAGTVSIQTVGVDEGNVTALLEASVQRSIDAMRALIGQTHAGTYIARRWESIETHMREAPIARFEYRFQTAGQPRLKVYHAMGGKPLGLVAREAFEGSSPLRTPDSPDSDFEWTDEAEARFQSVRPSDGELAAAEDADTVFYTGFDDLDVRAPFRSPSGSVMEAFWHEGRHHALDPEYKALRAIEDDLRNGVVARGGEIRGMVSTGACTTCRASARQLAAHFDVDIHMTQIFGSVPRSQRDALVASGRARLKGLKLVDAMTDRSLLAADVLADARAVQVRRNLNPSALNRVIKGVPWSGHALQLAAPRLPRISETSTASDESPSLPSDTPHAAPPEC